MRRFFIDFMLWFMLRLSLMTKRQRNVPSVENVLFLSTGIAHVTSGHALSYQNKTTQRVLLEKRQIGSSVKNRNKLKRVVKACSRFYALISSLLIKPKLRSEIGAIDVNQRFLVIESNFCSYYLKNILSYL